MTRPDRIVSVGMVLVFVILNIVKRKLNQNQNQMFNWNKNKEKPTVKLEGCLNPSEVEMCTLPGHGGYPKNICYQCLKGTDNDRNETSNNPSNNPFGSLDSFGSKTI